MGAQCVQNPSKYRSYHAPSLIFNICTFQWKQWKQVETGSRKKSKVGFDMWGPSVFRIRRDIVPITYRRLFSVFPVFPVFVPGGNEVRM